MKNLWKNDKLQFARLLCEIRANIKGTKKEWKELYLSTDLSQEEVNELFDRANDFWEEEKYKHLLDKKIK